MPTLIKDGQVASNDWQRVDMASGLGNVTGAETAERIIVPLAMWVAEKESLLESGKQVGVCLESEDDPYELEGDVDHLPLICLYFPVFRDGRLFSTAAILRKRLGFKGELRASGDFMRDQMFYLSQCGIDSFMLDDAIKVDEALSALGDFSTNYQSTIAKPEPLFRRR